MKAQFVNLRIQRISLMISALLYAGSVFADAASYSVNIPAQRLDTALQSLAQQSGTQILFVTDTVNNYQSENLNGQLTVEQALTELLKSKNLQIKKIGENKFSIVEGKPQARNMGQLNTIDVNASNSGMLVSDNNTVQLPVIIVSVENENSYTVKKVQAGSKMEQELKDIPRSISVISRQQLDDQGLVSLEDAIEQLPGMTTSYNTNGWAQNSYNVRGFGINSINVDGARTQTVTTGTSQNTGLAKYDSVQLVRGPEGLFSGNGGAGGTINLSRKRPTQDFQLKTALNAGSWDNYSGEIDISSPLTSSGNIRGRAVASHQDTDKFYSNTHRENTTLYGIIEADLSPNTLLSAGASYDKAAGTGQNDAPGFPRYSTGEPLPIPRNLGYITGTHRNSDSTNVFAGLEHEFNQNWKAKFNLNYTESNADTKASGYDNWYGGIDPLTNNGMTTGLSFQVDTKSDALAADFNVQGDLDLWGHANKLVFGADYVKTKTRNIAANRNGTFRYDGGDLVGSIAVDWNNFNPSLVEPSPNTPAHYIWNTKNVQYGAYLYNSFAILEPLKLIVGARLSSYKNDVVQDTFWNGIENEHSYSYTYNKDSSIFTPYYALQYDFLPNWTAYLTMTEGYEDQSNLYSEDFKPLNPTSSESYELGIKGEHFNGKLNSNITFYRTKRKELGVILATNQNWNDENTGKSCCYAQNGEFLGEGVEFDISGELFPNFQINAGYTYDDSVTKYGTNNGKRINSNAPKHIFRAWARYQFSRGWLENLAIGGGVKAQSDFYASGTVRTWNPTGGSDGQGAFDGPTVPYAFTEPGRAVWDAFARYKISPNWSATLNVNNLFDKEYFKTVGSTSGSNRYSEPRNFMLTLRAKY